MPAYEALYHGHLIGFLDLSPSYVLSLIWRAPFALIAMVCGAGVRGTLVATALPCYAFVPAFGLWLARRRARDTHTRVRIGILFALFAVADPLVWFTGLLGHPEELVGATLCLAAVLLAAAGRPRVAVGLVIFAVLNKPGLAEVVPVVLVAGDWRYRGTALKICFAAAGLWALYNLTGLRALVPIWHLGSTTSPGDFLPPQLLWWLGQTNWLARNEHVLLMPLGAAVAAYWSRHRDHLPGGPGGHRGDQALWLTALMMLGRTALDPWDNVYYNLPLALCLLTLEAPRRRRPRLTIAATAGALLFVPTNRIIPVSGSAQAALYAVVAAPALVLLARKAELLPSAHRPNTLRRVSR